LIEKMKADADYKDGEIDALANLESAEFANKMDELKTNRDRRKREIETQTDLDLKDDEFAHREKAENKFFDEREKLITGDN